MSNDRKRNTVLRRGMSDYDWRIARADDSGVPPIAWPPARTDPAADAAQRGGWRRRLRIVVVGIGAGLLVMLSFHASMKGFEANGVSMEPTLHDGDRLIVNRLAYSQVDLGILDGLPVVDTSVRWASPRRGDVIVFHSPVFGVELVKRIIGLPGERIEVRDGRVYADGEPLEEPYALGPTLCRRDCEWTVPDGEYFVLGDNRTDSRDSREGWTVPIGDIDGKELIAY